MGKHKHVIIYLAKLKKHLKAKLIIVFFFEFYPEKYLEAIINVFTEKNNIDGIITSDIDVSYKLKDKDTQARGRYIRLFLAPMLYGDDVKSKDYHAKALENYGVKDAAIELHKHLVNYSGKDLTFRQILEKPNQSIED